MGDRGNIVVVDDGPPLYLYTHNEGSWLPEILADSLERAQRHLRLDDGPYLARIVFDQMIGREGWGASTGFGISTTMVDNENPLLVLDVKRQRVIVVEARYVGHDLVSLCGMDDPGRPTCPFTQHWRLVEVATGCPQTREPF